MHAGLSARQGNHLTFPMKEKEIARQNNVHAFQRDILLKDNIRFDILPLMEDFHVTLSLLELGYPNLVLQNFCWGQIASNNPGGCSLYRNMQMQKDAATKLHELHPKFVKIITKKNKTGWKDMDERTDVRIQWKKAFGTKYDDSD